MTISKATKRKLKWRKSRRKEKEWTSHLHILYTQFSSKPVLPLLSSEAKWIQLHKPYWRTWNAIGSLTINEQILIDIISPLEIIKNLCKCSVALVCTRLCFRICHACEPRHNFAIIIIVACIKAGAFIVRQTELSLTDDWVCRIC